MAPLCELANHSQDPSFADSLCADERVITTLLAELGDGQQSLGGMGSVEFRPMHFLSFISSLHHACRLIFNYS